MFWFEPAEYVNKHGASPFLVRYFGMAHQSTQPCSAILLGPEIGAQGRATDIALEQLQLTMRSPNRIRLICPTMLVDEANAHG